MHSIAYIIVQAAEKNSPVNSYRVNIYIESEITNYIYKIR